MNNLINPSASLNDGREYRERKRSGDSIRLDPRCHQLRSSQLRSRGLRRIKEQPARHCSPLRSSEIIKLRALYAQLTGRIIVLSQTPTVMHG